MRLDRSVFSAPMAWKKARKTTAHVFTQERLAHLNDTFGGPKSKGYDSVSDGYYSYVASPFVIPYNMRFLDIGTYVWQAGSGTFRVGIYTDLRFYPDKLIADSGALSVSTIGNKWRSPQVAFNVGGRKLHWLVVHHGGIGGAYIAYSYPNDYPVFYGDMLGINYGWLAFAPGYAALPAVYPAGAWVQDAGFPMRLMMR